VQSANHKPLPLLSVINQIPYCLCFSIIFLLQEVWVRGFEGEVLWFNFKSHLILDYADTKSKVRFSYFDAFSVFNFFFFVSLFLNSGSCYFCD